MKKIIRKSFALISVGLLLFACQEDSDVIRNDNFHTISINEQLENIKGVNKFSTSNELQKLIDSDSSTEKYNLRNRVNPQQRVKGVDGDLLETEENEDLLFELIPNENLRNIVNAKGEFIVGDTIYKVSTLGTLYTNIQNREKLNQIDSTSFAQATYIREKVKRVENVFLYETFGEDEQVGDEYVSNVQESTTLLPNKAKRKQTVATKDNVDIYKFPVKDMERFTWFGKGRDKIFGNDKWHREKISKKRRLAANLYDYNYVVVKSSGFAAKVQRKKLFWRVDKDWNRGITIGWKGLTFKINSPALPALPFKEKSIYDDSQYIEYKHLDFKEFPFSVGDRNVTVVVPYLWPNGKTFTFEEFQKMIYKFVGGQLVSSLNSAKKKANGFAVIVPQRRETYVYIADTKVTTYEPEFNYKYYKDWGFEVVFGLNSDFAGYIGESINRTRKLNKPFELIGGMAYAYTPNGDGTYTGMIVKKYTLQEKMFKKLFDK